MMKRLAAMLALAAAWFPATSHADPVKLKMAFYASDTTSIYVNTFVPFANAVNADPAHAVQIELYPNGALGRVNSAQAQMLLDGVADIAMIDPGGNPGRFPDDGIMLMPNFSKNLSEGTQLYRRLLDANALRGYGDYYIIGGFVPAPYSIHSKVPVTGLKDLKGLKIRIGDPINGEAARALGMVPVPMGPNEVPEAISRGTIDASMAPLVVLFDFGQAKVTKYDYFVPLGPGPIALAMSRKSFDSLPPAGQATIRKYAGDWIEQTYIKAQTAYENSLMDKLKADPERHITFASAADLASVEPAFAKVRANWAAKDPHNQALLQNATQLLTEIRAGK